MTVAEKRKILTSSIFGTDIDAQAVEVTQMSLFLKVLEGESRQTLEHENRLFPKHTILPDLSNNIFCGNALVSHDYLEFEEDLDELIKKRPFSWNAIFKSSKKNDVGHFDFIVGNPPYIRSQNLDSLDRRYFEKRYASATATFDIYVVFIERALELLRKSGRAAFIVSNKWFTTDYGLGLRKIVASKGFIEKIVDFEDAQVFHKAGTYTCVLVLDKSGQNEIQYAQLGHAYRGDTLGGLQRALLYETITFKPFNVPKDGRRWSLTGDSTVNLWDRLGNFTSTFADLDLHIFQGLKTSADKIYLMTVMERCEDRTLCINGLNETVEIETALLRKVLKGESVDQFHLNDLGRAILYPYKIIDGSTKPISQKDFKSKYPLAWTYLKKHRGLLGRRDKGKWAERNDWYIYARSQNLTEFFSPKIMVPYMTNRMRAAFDPDGQYCFVNISTGGYGVRAKPDLMPYLTCLLNTRLYDTLVQSLTNDFRGGYFAVNKQALERLPVIEPRKANSSQKKIINALTKVGSDLTDLKSRLSAGTSNANKNTIDSLIAQKEDKLEKMVLELFGLT